MRYITALSLSRVGVVVIGALSFWLSYIALTALARDAGFGIAEGYAWPVIVDGVVVVSTVALFASRDRFALFLLICGAAVSLAGNGIHAWTLTHSWVAVAAFEIPPLALLAVSHLSMRLAKHADRAAAEGIVESAVEPAVEHIAEPVIAEQPEAHHDAPNATETNETDETIHPHTPDTEGPYVPTPGPLSPLEKRARAYELLDEGVSGHAVARNLEVSEASVRRWKKARDESTETDHAETAA